MEVEIKIIPHNKQRYDTVGDYWTTADGVIHFRISAMGDWRYEALVAFHELAEKFITMYQGVTEEEIDQYDMAYEKLRTVDDDSEPGESQEAPYHMAHQAATMMEMMLGYLLGVDWEKFDEVVRGL